MQNQINVSKSMSIIDWNNSHYHQQQILDTKRNKINLDALTLSTNKNLPLHIYLFHDMWCNPITTINEIDTIEYINQANIMIITYDEKIKIICKPILATLKNMTLIKNSIYMSGGYRLTIDPNKIISDIKSGIFNAEGCDLSAYNGEIFIHQLN